MALVYFTGKDLVRGGVNESFINARFKSLLAIFCQSFKIRL